jgi:predicted Zn-dependent protease
LIERCRRDGGPTKQLSEVPVKKFSTLLKITPAILLIAGCGSSGSNSGSSSSGGSNSNNVSMISSLVGSIPGMNSGKTQQALQFAQVGAKGMDYLDLNSPQRQDEIGQAVAVAITNRYPLSNDQNLTDYVNLVGLTVASVAPNSDINYCFGVLDTQEVGAYSAPGGYVFVTRGAIALCQDEAELAGVLAHEIAHVALHHGIDAVKAAKGTDTLLSAAKTADARAQAYGQFLDTAADTIIVKGYSRDQESKADAQAVKYLEAAGYDPAGLLRFLQHLQAATGSGGGVKQLMSTHPGTADRVTAVQRQVAANAGRGATLRERFATNVR